MTGVIVHHHTGLGDHFMCNGLVHRMLEKYGQVDLICKDHLVKSVSHLYEDWPEIKIIPIRDETTDVYLHASLNNKEIIRVGFENCDFNAFEDSFYTQLELDPADEFENFKLPSRLQCSYEFSQNVLGNLPPNFIFVHNVSSYKEFNLKIDSNNHRFIVRKEDTDDILDYIDAMIQAKEVHVINSGLSNLVFQLVWKEILPGEKVFYHDARKLDMGGIPIKVPHNVKVIEYE